MTRSKIEQAILDRILYIGEDIPEGLDKERPKFVLLGYPDDFINELIGEGNGTTAN